MYWMTTAHKNGKATLMTRQFKMINNDQMKENQTNEEMR